MIKADMLKSHNVTRQPSRGAMLGASLVEVLVAILLFALGTLTVLTMTISSMQANNSSRSVDAATNLGRTLMDRLLFLDYDHADLQDRTADGPVGLLEETLAGADFSQTSGNYQIFWNVAGNLPVNNTKTLCTIVTWQHLGNTKRVVFQSIKAK